MHLSLRSVFLFSLSVWILAACKTPRRTTQAQQAPAPKISIVTYDLPRFSQTSGVVILYYGSGGTASSFYATEVSFKKGEKTEAQAAEEVRSRYSGSGTYIGYEFKNGYKCMDAEGYLCQKFGVDRSRLSQYGRCY